MKNPLKSRVVGVLAARYRNDILYDAHQTETKIQRSESGQELRRRGKYALGAIAHQLATLPPVREGTDAELFMAWVILINSIITDHDLPLAPYDGSVPLGEQKVEAWSSYCLLFAEKEPAPVLAAS